MKCTAATRHRQQDGCTSQRDWFGDSSMSRSLLSLWLFGAVLYTLNTLTMAKLHAPSGKAAPTATECIKDASSAGPQTISTPQTKRPQAPEASVKPSILSSQDVTGSVGAQTAKTQVPNSEMPQFAEIRGESSKVEDEAAEWAEVSLAAQVHSAPSVSAPTIRYYRVGTTLRIIGREPGWIKVVHPTSLQEGWVYEKYLIPREGRDQKQAVLPQQLQHSAQAGSEMPSDMNVSAPTPTEPRARPTKLRKQTTWKRVGQPTFRFMFGVYPGW
jgi:hypothetical protein